MTQDEKWRKMSEPKVDGSVARSDTVPEAVELSESIKMKIEIVNNPLTILSQQITNLAKVREKWLENRKMNITKE